MFAYCGNSPVNFSDPSGCRPAWERLYGNGTTGFTDTATGPTQNVLVLSHSDEEWMHSSAILGDALDAALGYANSFVYAMENGMLNQIWNGIKKSYLIIHCHGSATCLQWENTTTRISDFNKLERNKKIKCVIIVACSCGGENGDQQNIGQIISQKIAADGFVICCSEAVTGNGSLVWSSAGGPWYIYQDGTLVRPALYTEFSMSDFVVELYS